MEYMPPPRPDKAALKPLHHKREGRETRLIILEGFFSFYTY